MTEPFALTAVEARQALIAGELSSAELVESCLDRIARVDPKVNAMVTVAAERARAEAAAADVELAAAGDADRGPHGRAQARARLMAAHPGSRHPEVGRPLLGLPVAIKDLQATAGVRTTLGSARFADQVPEVDAGIVARIRAAGGIVIGKTNIPERSIGANTVNRLFGATGNPFDPTRTCGGSSGGSAVALATDMAPLATGSDHGGSLRIPAAYCGVVGFRATPGVVPFEERAVTQTFYSVQGPMARCVDDAALLLSVIAAREPHGRPASGPGAWLPTDPMAFPLNAAGRFGRLLPMDLAGVRVGVSEDLGGVLVSAEVRDQFRRRVDWLADLVGSCEPVDIDLTDAADVDWNIRAELFATSYQAEAATWDEEFNPNIRASYEKALATPLADIARARHRQMELTRSFQAAMNDIDVLICPGVSVPPFPWSQLYPASVDGAPVDNYMAWLTLTAAITVVGHPAVSLPAGLDDGGLPFGLQLIGSAYDDQHLLMVARAIEGAGVGTDFARPSPDLDALLASNVDLSPAATAAIFS
ncbi:MAG: amidase [Acidimicrobiia bacterium]|nr:amidase [Acidimicrobiia bacterium]